MSTNLHIKATRKVQITRPSGKVAFETQYVSFDVYQTPTKVTYEILSKANNDEMADAYVQHVTRNFATDSDENREFTDMHVAEFRTFLRDCVEGEYDVEYYAM